MEFESDKMPCYIDEKQVAVVFSTPNKVRIIFKNNAMVYEIDFTYACNSKEFAEELIKLAKTCNNSQNAS